MWSRSDTRVQTGEVSSKSCLRRWYRIVRGSDEARASVVPGQIVRRDGATSMFIRERFGESAVELGANPANRNAGVAQSSLSGYNYLCDEKTDLSFLGGLRRSSAFCSFSRSEGPPRLAADRAAGARSKP